MTLENFSVHAKEYIGHYITSEDFAFQEHMRRVDLAIKLVVERALGPLKAEKFFANGWGKLIGAAYLQASAKNLKISEKFKAIISEKFFDVFCKRCLGEIENPFESLCIRQEVNFLTLHPTRPKLANIYLRWIAVEINEPIIYLNRLLENAQLNLNFVGERLYLEIKLPEQSNIIEKLWTTNFAKILEQHGFTGFEQNRQSPHINLANPQILKVIRRQFESKYGDRPGSIKMDYFFQVVFRKIQEEEFLKERPTAFTTLMYAFSEDCSPFEGMIVAKLTIPFFENAFKRLIKDIEMDLGVPLNIGNKPCFHLTVAMKRREPDQFMPAQIEDVLNSTGEHEALFRFYWQQFAAPSSLKEKTL